MQNGGHFQDGRRFRYGCNEITPTAIKCTIKWQEIHQVAPLQMVKEVNSHIVGKFIIDWP